MLSCHKNDSLTYISLFIDWLTNHQALNDSFRMSLTNSHLRYQLLEPWCFVSEISIQFLQRVRIRMSDEQFILFVYGGNLKTELIVHPSWILSVDYSFFIAHISPLSSPSLLNTENSLIFSKGVYSRRHSIVEQWVRFGKIDHIESVLLLAFHLLNRKVKPLIVALRIGIILHHQVIFQIAHLTLPIYIPWTLQTNFHFQNENQTANLHPRPSAEAPIFLHKIALRRFILQKFHLNMQKVVLQFP